MILSLQRPAAVIFDMDGVLLDSERVAMTCFAQAAGELGAAWEDKVGLAMVGMSSVDSDLRLRTVFGADYPVDAIRERFDVLYEHAIVTGAIPLKPFVRELLDRLEMLRIPCAVATSTQRMRAEAKLSRAKLLHRFAALACGDEVTRGKPAPDIFELAAMRLGVEPGKCLALEDSNVGVRAAVAAAMRVVMVPDLAAPDADIFRLGVARAESLKDVIVAL